MTSWRGRWDVGETGRAKIRRAERLVFYARCKFVSLVRCDDFCPINGPLADCSKKAADLARDEGWKEVVIKGKMVWVCPGHFEKLKSEVVEAVVARMKDGKGA